MATRRKTTKKRTAPRFTPRSLGDMIELALAMAGPEGLQVLEATAGRLDEKYSLRNRVAVAVQRPNATEVGGKGYWRDIGYRPGKGKQGLAIFFKSAPKKTTADTDDQPADQAPEKNSAEKTEEATPARRWSDYGVTYVWDRSQVVPLECACTGDCECPPAKTRPVTPAGGDPEGFAAMVAEAAENAPADAGTGED